MVDQKILLSKPLIPCLKVGAEYPEETGFLSFTPTKKCLREYCTGWKLMRFKSRKYEEI